MPESNKPMPHVGDPSINFNGSSKNYLTTRMPLSKTWWLKFRDTL